MTRTNASYQERLKAFQALLQNHQRIVFFGGAGVSTESLTVTRVRLTRRKKWSRIISMSSIRKSFSVITKYAKV